MSWGLSPGHVRQTCPFETCPGDCPRDTSEKRRSAGWPEGGELVGHLEAPQPEAEQRRGAPARAAGRAAAVGALEHSPAHEYALEVRRREVVLERRGVDLEQ